MVAYQAESDLVRLVAPPYKRVGDEGRTLIQSALASAADLEVTDTELRITLARPSVQPIAAARSRSSATNSIKHKHSFQAPGCDSATPSKRVGE
jgi:hypothetical protein